MHHNLQRVTFTTATTFYPVVHNHSFIIPVSAYTYKNRTFHRMQALKLLNRNFGVERTMQTLVEYFNFRATKEDTRENYFGICNCSRH